MRNHKLWWQSSYDRGLDVLLFMWPEILEKYPEAELHISYGWDLFDKVTTSNPERKQWKEQVVGMMNQKGIFHHGRIGQEELKKIRKECGIIAYPTYFSEINCISMLESQRDGLVPVTMNDYALKETAAKGILIDGDIRHVDVQEKYLAELLKLMGDHKRWCAMSEECKAFSKSYDWDLIAYTWDRELTSKAPHPLVSVVTITIREGWWNIMAQNLSNQTYKNFEWTIIDDHKTDRSKTAIKYAKKYNLNIQYIRGDKVLGKYDRQYGLVRANNMGWKAAKGSLLVYLQDFILIPENGIERLVDVHIHNPNALIAPVDQYWHCKTPDRSNKEDWWNGDTDVISAFSWRNIRVKFQGIKVTDNPFDFEMNYGAIPKHVLDNLGGWWEFFDDGLGFDNTEIALRAMKLGYKVVIDDVNVAKCINLWPIIGGTAENIKNRERTLAVPYFVWLESQMEKGTLPTIRTQAIDDTIKYTFTVPESVEDKDCGEWIEKHANEIAISWGDYTKS